MSESLLATDASPAVADGSVSGSVLSGWSDWIGMIASIGCAIHCAAMPFVIAYLPSLGLSFLSDESF
ncbi:MAG: MerC domain-containing protein, partial [Planctomycetota bacterium]